MARDRARQNLPFNDWKETLRQDCERQGKLFAFDALGEFVLTLWWESGTAPNVNAIVDAAPSNANR